MKRSPPPPLGNRTSTDRWAPRGRYMSATADKTGPTTPTSWSHHPSATFAFTILPVKSNTDKWAHPSPRSPPVSDTAPLPPRFGWARRVDDTTRPPQTHPKPLPFPLSTTSTSTMAAGRSPPLTGRRRGRGRVRRWTRPPKGSQCPSSPRSTRFGGGGGEGEQPPLAPGTEVEVRVDADGFHGSWFEAVVVGFAPARGPRTPARYAASYAHLVSDDGGVLVEHFAPSHIRPRPPPPSSSSDLRALAPHDIVEAFHKDGWWSGIVLAGGGGGVITVAFPLTREVIDFPPRLVRPRRDYVGGEWVPSEAAIAHQPKQAAAVRIYQVGDKVEVRRDREVYGRSWFHAKVAKVIDRMSYLVEYSDLEKGEGEAVAKAVEYLHWQFIRPSEERSPQDCDLRLGPGAAIEAYCDGAWSPGVVRRIVGEGEYEVRVNGKNNEIVVTKARELLQPQYKWNGKNWRIVSAKRRLRHQFVSGKNRRSPADEHSSDDEQRQDTESSAWTMSRKREDDSGSNTKYQQDDASNLTTVLQSAVARMKGFKGSDSQHNSWDATNTVQPKPRKQAARRLKRYSLERQLEGETHIQQQVDKTLEDNLNTNQVTYQELLPLTPPGFESIANGKRSCDWNTDGLSEINLHSSLFDDELAATISSICQDNHNGDAQTDNMVTQVAEISHLMDKPMLPFDLLVGHEVGGKVGKGSTHLPIGNSGSLPCTSDNTILRSCSLAGNSMASDMSKCHLPGQQALFTKTKDAWSAFEIMDVFRKDPQEPHFLPLQQFPEAVRENMAIGLFWSYIDAGDAISKLRITDSMKIFEKHNTTLNYLVGNGFNVQSLQCKLNKALQFKLDRTRSLAYKEKLKEQVLEKQSSLSRIGASRDENDSAIANLEMELGKRRWDGQMMSKRMEDEEAELSRLKAEDRNAQEACRDAEKQFRSVLVEEKCINN
uniref:Agenet domain-containing protein n=1 Tax=Oryza meridionalis TaxID=40149 RepID=A0A0E0DGI9_9ORYZ